MTEDDQDRIIGQTVQQLSSERKRLACLKAKAEQVTTAIAEVSAVLRFQQTAVVKGNEFAIDTKPDSGVSRDQVTWPTAEEIESIVVGIRSSEQKIKRMEERCLEFGIDLTDIRIGHRKSP